MTSSTPSNDVVVDRDRWNECSLLDDDATARVHQELALDAAEECLRCRAPIHPSGAYCLAPAKELASHVTPAAGATELSVERVVCCSSRRDLVSIALDDLPYDPRGEFPNYTTLPVEVDEGCSFIHSHTARVACQQQHF